MKTKKPKVFLILLISYFFSEKAYAKDLEQGNKLFISNCNVCHIGGNNLIIPEKNLKKETLKLNGMNDLNSIVYQITNGRNGMPAFGGRLTEKEIINIANYVLNESF
jgi:cytochrome c6